MADYESLVQDIRDCAESKKLCKECPFSKFGTGSRCKEAMARDAADAIEELLRVCKKMHTWIFLHTTDEQAAYDEIGLTDEQNAMFGYSGQMILKAEPPKGVE